MEGRKEKRKAAVRHERDEQSQSHGQAFRFFRHERDLSFESVETQVSYLSLIFQVFSSISIMASRTEIISIWLWTSCSEETFDIIFPGTENSTKRKHVSFFDHCLEFFIACILVSLEVIHGYLIIHRDIKPENLVFDNEGYLRLTDFGISRYWSEKNQDETSGTPGYMAPEVIVRTAHGLTADYFALGVIAYECMNGRRPYIGKNRKEIRDLILAKQV